MSTQDPQVIDAQEFIPVCDYNFTGNDVTVRNKRTFIENLRLKAAVYVAANVTGIAKLTAYRWRESDSEFAEAWEEALQDAADVMETSTYERALGRNGKPDTLLTMFWLKAHRPKYRDRVDVDVRLLEQQIEERLQGILQPTLQHHRSHLIQKTYYYRQHLHQ
jgi:hypothetical protein